ncbi:multicopper oxidase domain-containing protein [Desulfosporosinus fructosivorans]
MWKDTVNVPAGEYVDSAFTMTNPGTWMLHCHILDHEVGGMMTSIVAN